MKKTALGVFILVIILILTLTKTAEKTSLNKSPIKIGALLVLSGDAAKYGEVSKNAIQMAVDAYNQDKPRENQVEVIYEDTHGDAKTAVTSFQKLVTQNHVNALIGPLFQKEMSAISPLIAQYKIPTFALAPLPVDIRSNAPSNPLIVWPDPTIEAGEMAKYVFNKGARTIAILGTRDPWEAEVSAGFAAKFKELGGQVVSNEIVLPDAVDTRLSVTKTIATKPDAVFLGTYFKFVYYTKALHELGYKGKVYSIEADGYVAGETKGESNNLQFISPAYSTEDFMSAYKTKYNEEVSIPAGQSFDAMNLLLSIVPGNSNEKILSTMENLKEYKGVSGKIEFTSDRRTIFPFSIFEIQDGLIKLIK